MRPGGDNRFGKVAVLMGGQSAEREISLKSGAQVLQALQARGIQVEGVDVNAELFNRLEGGDFDRVFVILHGRGGEDGVLQGVMDSLKVPYTGSGVLASALCMDKHRSKLIWRALGLPTPAWMIVEEQAQCAQALEAFGLPLMVKPSFEGSSIGISKVESAEQLVPAWQKAREFGQVMIERCIIGAEYTASILAGEALPLIKLSTPHDFYDYQAKYFTDTTKYECPCGLSQEQEREVQQLCLEAFDALGGEGWGRVDLLLDESRQPWLIEANTAPGMTDHSLVPMAARAAGMDFGDLLVAILETTLEPNREQGND